MGRLNPLLWTVILVAAAIILVWIVFAYVLDVDVKGGDGKHGAAASSLVL